MSENQVEPTSSSNTGNVGEGGGEIKSKIVVYPFGPYEVLIKLLNSGEFVEIAEIRLNKDFRDFIQKTQSRGYHDVSDIYEQE